MSQLNLSARAYHRLLKLARTIADLAGCEEIQCVHLAEAPPTARSSEIAVELWRRSSHLIERIICSSTDKKDKVM